MNDTILVAIITSAVSLVSIWATYRANTKKIGDEFAKTNAEFQRQSAATDAKLDKKMAVLEERLEGLTKETRRHNNFAERVPALEARVEDMNERLKYREQLGG